MNQRLCQNVIVDANIVKGCGRGAVRTRGTMDDDQQFCLRWNNHQSTLVSVFDTLLEKGMHVDCTLAAEGQTLKAHKVVLSACSPYFENVLSQQFDKHPIIILKDVKYAELRAMMDYMYRGEVNISQDQLAALLKAAESLQIKGLSDNKPSRPPSRPAPPAAAHPPLTALPHPAHPAHPPRAPTPQTQPRDGSVDSREGSVSPTRRRKKARRASSSGQTETSNGVDEPQCKQEAPRDNVEDLTNDEDHDDPPQTHNDVVRIHYRAATLGSISKKARRASSSGQTETSNGVDEPQCKQEAPRDTVEDLTNDEDHDDPPQTHNDVVRIHYRAATLGSISKKARRASSSGQTETSNGVDEPQCKQEAPRDNVEDLTNDEDHDDPPQTHNDVVRNFQWHMERSQDELMNSSDSVRDSQDGKPRIVTRSKKAVEEPEKIQTFAVLKTVKSAKNISSPAALLTQSKENTRAPSPVKPKPSPPIPAPMHHTPIHTPTNASALERLNIFSSRRPPPCAQYKTEKGYKCPNCQRCYNARKNLVRHVTLECGIEPQYKCPHCSYRKHRRNELKKHMEKKHPDLRQDLPGTPRSPGSAGSPSPLAVK
ncbi:BTB/POZ domain-containing protein [Phthorimaea operculella]|nr:BTB/POZ domain-containing protein [Phthorimaea operculella]